MMRKILMDHLVSFAYENKDVWLLVGDLGYSFVEEFQNRFPSRFINVGAAEQNMISIAAGLALEGKKVFAYSIINFCTFRCLEQIRNDVCYHNLDVTILGIGSGYSYGDAGYTHHAIEDIGIMKILPNIEIFSPSSDPELKNVLRHIFKVKNPKYLRIEKSFSYQSQSLQLKTGVGANIIQPGKDITLASYGRGVFVAQLVSQILENLGISSRLVSLQKVFPLNRDEIIALMDLQGFFVIEEHIHSGLGSSIAEILIEQKFPTLFRTFCLNSKPIQSCGSQNWLAEKQGLNPTKIAKEIRLALSSKMALA